MKHLITIVLACVLAGCGGSDTGDSSNETIPLPSQPAATTSIDIESLKITNCGNAPATLRPDHSVLDVYSYPIRNRRLSYTPSVHTRCSNGYCDEYIYDSNFKRLEWHYTRPASDPKPTLAWSKIYTYTNNKIDTITHYENNHIVHETKHQYGHDLLLIKQTTTFDSDNKRFIDYKYHSTGLLARVDSGQTFSGVTKLITYSEYTYCDNKNLLLRSSGSHTRGPADTWRVYNYDSDGKLIQTINTRKSPDDVTIVYYEYNNGNLILEKFDGIGRLPQDGIIDFNRYSKFDEYNNLTHSYGHYPQLSIFEGNRRYAYTYILN